MASRHFGHIEGIEVGETFESRRELHDLKIHMPLMAGVAGGQDGADSIVLNEGYEDILMI